MSFDHILAKVGDAASAGGTDGMSTGERLMAALVLNRADWLSDAGYTIAGASERVGPKWVSLIPRVARLFANEQARAGEAAATARDALAVIQARWPSDSEQEIYCQAQLVTVGEAPSYRDVTLVFKSTFDFTKKTLLVQMRLPPDDSEAVAGHVRCVLTAARDRGAPLDVRPSEKRSSWISSAAAGRSD